MKNRRDEENSFVSALSFWKDANQGSFDVIASTFDSDQVFTSVNSENCKSPHIKFIIKSIEYKDNCTLLVGEDVVCKVSGEWQEINFCKNTKVTVTGCLCCDGEISKNVVDGVIQIEVNDTDNWLFIEDHLMTVTNFVSATKCVNNPLLNSKLIDLSFDFRDKCLVIGIILHDVMESCLLEQNFSIPFINEKIQSKIEKNLMNVYMCKTTESCIREELNRLMQNVKAFDKHRLQFDECEKRIVSQIMNLKGNIDAIGKKHLLELKSGRCMDVSHKAQVLLYNLMVKEKYNISLQSCLYYIGNMNLLQIDIKHDEVKSLMILRNKVIISEVVACECADVNPCRIVQKILQLPHTHFLKQQWLAIEKEEKQRMKENWHFVTFTEQVDTSVVFSCTHDNVVISDMHIDVYSEEFIKLCKGIILKVEGVHIHISLCEKINLAHNTSYYISFGSSDLSYRYMKYALVNIAYFRYLEKGSASTFLLPDEDKGLQYDDDMSFSSIDEECFVDSIEDEDVALTEVVINQFTGKRTCESESAELPSTNGTAHNYLLKQEHEEHTDSEESNDDIEMSPTCKRYKENDEHVNSFSTDTLSSFQYFTPPITEAPKLKYSIPKIYTNEFLRLNDAQKAGLLSALNCDNYKIVHGMPGTGKSTVIRLLIKILVLLNKKVLLVCYTNLAITNILSKLSTIRTYRAGKENIPYRSVDDITRYFKNVDVVASTCFGFKDPIFIDRHFDFCIIDEGSQQHLLLTLIPVARCSKFVIFGDHLQLKPLCKSSHELKLSLFEYLLDDNCIELRTQYRMGPNIMQLSNTLFYNNRLVCGVESVDDEAIFVDTAQLDYSVFMKDLRNATVLCYFNSQVRKTKELTNCQVETIDRFQGSEAENIVVVFDPVVKCDVIESKERLNVALTRAKRSLILLGNLADMKEVEILFRLLETMNVI